MHSERFELISDDVFTPPIQTGLEVDVIRELTQSDIKTLDNQLPMDLSPPVTLARLRSSHHQLARLLAIGKSNADVSLLTGYSTGYINSIQGDPAFRGLMTHYAGVQDLVFVDVLERMKSLGIDTLDELKHRMTENPDKFSIGQLQEQIKLLLVSPIAAAAIGRGASANGPSATINVKFVGAKPAVVETPVVIDGEMTEINPREE